MFPHYLWKKRSAFWNAISLQDCFNLFKNVFVKDHGDSQLLKKKDLISIKIFLYFIDVYRNFTTNLNTITILNGNKKEIKEEQTYFIIHKE